MELFYKIQINLTSQSCTKDSLTLCILIDVENTTRVDKPEQRPRTPMVSPVSWVTLLCTNHSYGNLVLCVYYTLIYFTSYSNSKFYILCNSWIDSHIFMYHLFNQLTPTDGLISCVTHLNTIFLQKVLYPV